MPTANRDPALTVRVLEERPLCYTQAPADAPPHVRAASAIVTTPWGQVIVQDDAHWLGLLDATGLRALPLPAEGGERLFEVGRGNKHRKADSEAGCVWPGPGGDTVVVFGSGSSPRRERLLALPVGGAGYGDPRWIESPELYALLRALLPPEVELNIEGAFPSEDGGLTLLQRGNGRGAMDAALTIGGAWLDARLADRARAPEARGVVPWALGALDGVRLTFTDGLAGPGEGFTFAASAEASPDAIDDGPVVGSAVGWIRGTAGAWAPLVDTAGEPVRCKLEGITRVGPNTLWGVVDADDPLRPSTLLTLRLEGPWP